MIDKAISKIRAEIEKNNGNQYIQYVGSFLLKELEANPTAAEKILTEGKTIAKSLDAMAEEAKKKPRIGSCAMLTPEEGFKVVLKYFGIETKSKLADFKPVAPAYESMREKKPSDIEFDVRLDDFLS
ncbi:MAG: hypothetical protein ACOZCL_08600 [Bacillota bacterium]